MLTTINTDIPKETTRNYHIVEAMGSEAALARLDELDREPNIEHFIEVLRGDGIRSKDEIQKEREALLRYLK